LYFGNDAPANYHLAMRRANDMGAQYVAMARTGDLGYGFTFDQLPHGAQSTAQQCSTPCKDAQTTCGCGDGLAGCPGGATVGGVQSPIAGKLWEVTLVGAERQGRDSSSMNASPPGGSPLNSAGQRILDDACVVQTADGGPYYMKGFAYLERVPDQPNKCFFRDSSLQREVMDLRLHDSSSKNACGRGSFLFDPAVTESVAKMDVNDRQRCVVAFKPTATTSQVESYERSTRDSSISMTNEYQALDANRRQNVIRLSSHVEVTSAMQNDLRDIIRMRDEERTSAADAQMKIDLQPSLAPLVTRSDALKAELDQVSSSIATLENERIPAAERRLEAAKARYSEESTRYNDRRASVATTIAQANQLLTASQSVDATAIDAQAANIAESSLTMGAFLGRALAPLPEYSDRNWFMNMDLLAGSRDSTVVAGQRECAQRCANHASCAAAAWDASAQTCTFGSSIITDPPRGSSSVSTWVKTPPAGMARAADREFQGTEIRHRDLRFMPPGPSTTYDACKEACRAEGECGAVTWGDSACWLKKPGGKMAPNPGMTTWVKNWNAYSAVMPP
jgi:hypothetical protein